MKYNMIVLGVLLALSACNNEKPVQPKASHDMGNMSVDSMKSDNATIATDIKAVSATFLDVDPKVSASIKEVVDHYLHIKNALAKDDGREAAIGGSAMVEALSRVDKSLLTAEQKKVYDQNQGDLKENAEHIGKNGDKISHQREHFSYMSQDVYELARAFGGGRPLYHDHCPMYNEKKGAMWLSETMEVRNPYFGSEMSTCGTIEEMIK